MIRNLNRFNFFFLFSLIILCVSSAWSQSILKVTMIDVRHGDSILIETPGGKTILIDAGKGGPREGQRIVPILEKKGVKKIDTLLLTHHHGDHFGGMANLVDHFTIGEFIDTDSAPKDVKKLREKMDQKHIPRHVPKLDETFDWGGGAIAKVVSTYNPSEVGDDSLNNNSIVVKLTYKNNSFLLTGDLEGSGESYLLKRNIDISADVLKAGHHGGEYGSNLPFLRKVNPKFVLVSSGGPFFLGPLTIERYRTMGAEVFRTDINGDIELTSDGQNITAKVQKSDLPSSCMDYFAKLGKDGFVQNKSSKHDFISSSWTVQNGKLNGVYGTFWGPDRFRQKAIYKDNKLDGPYLHTNPNGKPKAKMTFVNGKLNGPVQFFDNNGSLLAEGETKDDQFLSSKIFYDNGKLFKEVTFENGKASLIKQYAEDGTLLGTSKTQAPEVKQLESAPSNPSQPDKEKESDSQSDDQSGTQQ